MTNTTPEHEHEFAIPVEWREIPNSSNGYGEGSKIDRSYPVRTTVTKLRCRCGEETER